MKKSMIVFPLLAIFFATGCEEDKDNFSGNNLVQEITLGAEIYPFSSSTQGSILPANSQVGVYLNPVKKNATPLYENTLFVSANDQTDLLQHGAQQQWFYPADGSFVDLMVYTPFKEEVVNSLYPIDLNSTDAPLYFGRKINLNATSGKALIRLYPVLSNLCFTFVPSPGFVMTDLQGMSVALQGVVTTASFNLLKGCFESTPAPSPSPRHSSPMASPNEQAMNLQWEPTKVLAQTQVIPVVAPADLKLVINLPAIGKSYTYPLSGSIANLNSSVQYDLNIVVGAGELMVSVSESSPILGWTPNTPIYW